MASSPNKERYIANQYNRPFKLENPLHKYASYNYLFTLSGMHEDDLKDSSYLTRPLKDVIARSSGIGPDGVNSNLRDKEFEAYKGDSIRSILRTEELRKQASLYADSVAILNSNHDIFFENVNILSTIGPNTERSLANFTKMEFELHEPLGITLVEKIRAATFLNGFLDYQDAPLLLTIQFRGFDENGKPLGTDLSETRKIPILIAKVDFEVNEGGARYSVIAVPYSDVGFDDRHKVLRTRVELTENKGFKAWKQKFETALAEQMEKEKKERVRVYEDIYQFEVEDNLLDESLEKYAFEADGSQFGGPTVDDELQSLKENILSGDGGQFSYDAATVREAKKSKQYVPSTSTQTADSGTTVVKAFEDWLRNRRGFFDLAQDFWRSYLTMAGYPVPTGDRKVDEENRLIYINKLLTDKSRADELQNVFLEHQYVPWFKIKSTIFTDTKRLDPITKMHPKRIVYKAIKYRIHILKMLATGLSIGKVDWSKLVRKNYDYIYTGDNVDVQNLRINYKTAYYMRNVRGDDKTENEKGFRKFVTQLSNQAFGTETYPEPYLPLRTAPSNIKGRSTVENFRPNGQRAQEFFDYLTNPTADMMRIELDILGDPHYLCQDVFACLKEVNQKKTDQVIKIKADFDSNQFQSFNADQYMPLINLRYRLPNDIDEQEGTSFSAKKKYLQENLFFNGVYQVYKVESKFDNGQFLQTLFCVRMNNQQGQGSAPRVLSSQSGAYTDASAETEIEKINKKRELRDKRKANQDEFDLLFGG